MQRLNLSVDLEDNKFLSEEIEKAIEGAVKAKTREYFHKTLETELKRIADKTTESWTYRDTWGNNPNHLELAIRQQINAKIESEIGKIDISKAEIASHIESNLKRIEYYIKYAVEKKIENIPFEKWIAKMVAEEVAKDIPAAVLDLMIKGARNSIPEETKTISPSFQITLDSSASREDMEKAINLSVDKFREMMVEYEKERERNKT